MEETKKTRKKMKLKWSMLFMLVLCWLIPLALIAASALYLVSNRMNSLIERNILISMDKAADVCEAQLEDAKAASRNASYLGQIRRSYRQYKIDGDKDRLYRDVTSFLRDHYRFNWKFLNAMVVFREESSWLASTYRMDNTPGSTYESVREFNDRTKALVLDRSKTLDTEIDLMNSGNHLYMVRNLMDSHFQPFAVIVMELDVPSIYGSLESMWGYLGARVYKNGELLASFGEPVYLYADKLLEETKGSVLFRDENGGMVALTVRRSGQDLTAYVVKMDSRAIWNESDTVRYAVFVLMLFMIPLIFLVLWFFQSKVNRPVRELVMAAKKIEHEEYGHQIERMGNSQEFGYLNEAFNSMSSKIKEQFDKIYKEDLALKDAEIKALQSQINPHFLNNTLEIINWEARMGDNDKVCKMLEALSTMLGATLNRKQQQFILLSEELSYVDAYLYIIKERLGERITVEKEVDRTLLGVEVPRLIIQPIIENAVKHGVDMQGGRGYIKMRIFRSGDKMIIETRNSGGMTEKDKKKIALLLDDDYEAKNERSTSLGIHNVNRRLKIIYGNSCGLTVKSDEKSETVSQIIVKID